MKSILTLLLLITTVVVFAQKSVIVGVCPATYSIDTAKDGDDRIKSLLNEYFRAELATHAGISVADSTKVETARQEISFDASKDATAEQIKKFSHLTGSTYTALVNVQRLVPEEKLKAIVTIYRNSDGKKLGTATSNFETIGDTNVICRSLAEQASKLIRGKRSEDEMKDSFLTESSKKMDEKLPPESKVLKAEKEKIKAEKKFDAQGKEIRMAD